MAPVARRLLILALAGFALAACAQRASPRATQAAPPPATAPAASTAPATVPGYPQWQKTGVTSTQYREDIESCHNYALAQIAHDERIESDSGAAFEVFPSGLGVTDLSQQMNQFERKNRRASLYSDCMRDKGYRKQ